MAGFAHHTSAVRAVRSYFGRLPVMDAAERRDLWRERLEHLWRQAVVDVREQRPGAVRAAVAVAQRASLLDGLDAPQRAEVTVSPAFEDIYAWVQQAAHLASAEPPVIEAEIVD